MPRATLMRLGSLLMGLVLVGGIMSSLRTPETQYRLAVLFGGAAGGEPAEQVEARAQRGAKLAAKVDRQLLESLDDDTPFRDAETPAWFHLLELARDTPPTELSAASAGEIAYAQLLQQPRHYRGKVITVSGLAHRIEEITPAENDLGIDTLYRVIVQPGGNGRLPFTCFCLELPEGFSIEGTPRPVRIEGFFVKNLVYAHAEGLDKTPVIAARSLVALDTQVATSSADRSPSRAWMIAIVAAVAIGVALFLWQATRPPRPLPLVAALHDNDDPATVGAVLRELAEASEADQSEESP